MQKKCWFWQTLTLKLSKAPELSMFCGENL